MVEKIGQILAGNLGLNALAKSIIGFAVGYGRTGIVADNITVDTDFLIVGVEPVLLRRPTQAELDIDPMAQQRYERSVQKIDAYNQLLEKAASLGIPVFNQKRFLFLIGYDTLMNKNPML